jgi:hypothetical protein
MRHPQIKHLFLLFVDGLGIGENDPRINPCTSEDFVLFQQFKHHSFPRRIHDHGFSTGLDAGLDVPGLPQSATGQTALLTGQNAPALLGRHLSGFPNSRLRQVIQDFSVLKHLNQCGRHVRFINTFRPPFFDYDPSTIIRHLSATTLTNLYANLPFAGLDDFLARKSLYHDITGKALVKKGFDVPLRTPEEAAEIAASQISTHDFILYEFFQTDQAGHSQDIQQAVSTLRKLHRFLSAVIENVSLSDTLILVTSDHGNIEDLSFRGHSQHAAMTLILGPDAESIAPRCKRLTDITPLILNLTGCDRD